MLEAGHNPSLHEELHCPTPYQAALHRQHMERRRRMAQAAHTAQIEQAKAVTIQELTKAAKVASLAKFRASQIKLTRQERAKLKASRQKTKILQALNAMPMATARAIVQQVAKEHNLEPNDILGPSRVACVTRARFIAVDRVAKANRGWSLVQLGQFFNRDHSTIVSCLIRMREGCTREEYRARKGAKQ